MSLKRFIIPKIAGQISIIGYYKCMETFKEITRTRKKGTYIVVGEEHFTNQVVIKRTFVVMDENSHELSYRCRTTAKSAADKYFQGYKLPDNAYKCTFHIVQGEK